MPPYDLIPGRTWVGRRTAEEIVGLFQQRSTLNPWSRSAMQIRALYNNEPDRTLMPLPELDEPERELPIVANLLQTGVDGTAQRITSTMPDVVYPAERPGIKTSEEAARIRRLWNLGVWDENHMDLILGLRARHFIAYSTSPVYIRPNGQTQGPQWRVRDPLVTWPTYSGHPTDIHPLDIMHCYQLSRLELVSKWPDKIASLYMGDKPRPDDMFDVVEYMDDQQCTLIVLGRPRQGKVSDRVFSGQGKQVLADPRRAYGASPWVVLHNVENRIGTCPAVAPGRIVLDKPLGQFDGMLGKYYYQQRVASLELIAIERGIFPEQWLESAGPGSNPQVITVADGRAGVLGEVKDGRINTIGVNPGYKTTEAIDRLERAQRIEGPIPAEFGGESTSTVRTGRRGDSILAAAVDFNIQEAQKVFARSLQLENQLAMATQKAYFPKGRSFYVSWQGADYGNVDVNPDKHFTSDRNIVRYSAAGSDANGLTIRTLQLLGAEVLSKRTAREMMPDIPDAEAEHDRQVFESVEMTVLEAFKQQAVNGEIPAADAAEIANLIVSNKASPMEAIIQWQKVMQERQATMVAPDDPAAQPGLAMPGMGAEAPAPIPEVEPGTARLAQLLSATRRPQMILPMEQAV